MYHAHFRGTHYEAGFRWGSLLLKHKNIILENIPFEITQERIDYALSCLPIYEKYYHEIMEEIQGLADGQQCDVRILQAALFSMYSMPPSCNCSCFAFTTEHEILLGRNSDFLTEIERLNQNVVYIQRKRWRRILKPACIICARIISICIRFITRPSRSWNR